MPDIVFIILKRVLLIDHGGVVTRDTVALREEHLAVLAEDFLPTLIQNQSTENRYIVPIKSLSVNACHFGAVNLRWINAHCISDLGSVLYGHRRNVLQ